MKLAIGTIFYNSKAELKRLIESIPDKAIDWFIGIDGIFQYTKEQNPNLSDLSNDGSRELFVSDMIDRTTNIASYRFDMPNSTEYDKRNEYLNICRTMEIDYLIIVDSDEYFVYNEGISPERSWDIFKKNFEMLARKNGFKHNVFSIRTFNPNTNIESSCPRCWYNPADMSYVNLSHYHYGNIHNKEEFDKIQIAREQNLNFCQESKGVIKGLTLAHDHSLRSKKQLQIREKYQKYLVTYESLVQNGYSHDKAHKIAKLNPSNEFNPT